MKTTLKNKVLEPILSLLYSLNIFLKLSDDGYETDRHELKNRPKSKNAHRNKEETPVGYNSSLEDV